MEEAKTSVIHPVPGYFLAIIEDSQMANVNFKGDDKFDLPQTGILIGLHLTDNVAAIKGLGDSHDPNEPAKYGDLVGRRVMWAKYAESDCLIYDSNLQKDVVLIALDKLRGYE